MWRLTKKPAGDRRGKEASLTRSEYGLSLVAQPKRYIAWPSTTSLYPLPL